MCRSLLLVKKMRVTSRDRYESNYVCSTDIIALSTDSVLGERE